MYEGVYFFSVIRFILGEFYSPVNPGRFKGLLDPEQKRSPPQEIEQFRHELEELLKELRKTLVVFIDNLDRCLPRNTILTLEAVRLFLFVPNTAFVVAADEDMVRLAVADHYKANAERLVTDYLDKLVQFPIRVPRVGVAEVRAYLIALLISQPSDASHALTPEIRETVFQALVRNLQNTWKDGPIKLKGLEEAVTNSGLSTFTSNQGQALVEAVQIADRLAPLLATSKRVGGNPRIVKRMLNTVRMRLSVAQRRQMPLSEALLAKMALFERCMGEAATNVLLTEIGNAKDGKPELLIRLETDEQIKPDDLPKEWQGPSESEFVRGWIELEPKLADVDLRPVAYLTRELKPVRTSTEGLSANAETALRVLLKARSSTSPTVKQTLGDMPPDERPVVMQGLIDHLERESDWKAAPGGLYGAISLADHDESAARDFAIFIRSRNFDQNPKWLSAALKDKSWWAD